MPNFAIPAAWEEDGSTGSSQIVYVVTPDHTSSENYQVLFDRKVPVYSNGSWSMPTYRIRIRRTFVDGDGAPIAGVGLVDCQMRWPTEATAADVKAMVTLLGTISGDANLAADVVDLQRLPR